MMMRFDKNSVRLTRKIFQWSVVPMAILAVLTLGRPLLPLFICFTSIAALGCAVVAGVVEEQIAVRESPWLWRWANRFPRDVVEFRPCEQTFDYRRAAVIFEPKIWARYLHPITRVVALMPVWMGGRGLGWRLFKRWAVRSFNEWDRTPNDAGDRFVQSIVEELRRQERLELLRSTHVGCKGSACDHCNDLASRTEGG